MKKLLITLLLTVGFMLAAYGAENGPAPLVTTGSVSGLGTIATIDSPVPIANGGTGATSAATGLAALGGAALNGNIAVPFSASTINGVAPLTAAEKTQALVGSSSVDFLAQGLNTLGFTSSVDGTSTYSGANNYGMGVKTITLTSGSIATFSNIIPPMTKTGTSLLRGRVTITGVVGMLFTASVYLSGDSNVATEVDDVFNKTTVTKNSATSINIYSVGGGNYEIQNTSAGTIILILVWQGA